MIYDEKNGLHLLSGGQDLDGDSLSLYRINDQIVTEWPFVLALPHGTLSITQSGIATYDDGGNTGPHPGGGETTVLSSFAFTLWDGQDESAQHTAHVELLGNALRLATKLLHLPDTLPDPINTDVILYDFATQSAHPGFSLSEINSSVHSVNSWLDLPDFGEIKSISNNGYLQARISGDVAPDLEVFETHSQHVPYQIADSGTQVRDGGLEVIFEGTSNHAGTLTSLRPDWAELRLAIPNNIYSSTAYTSLGGLVWSADTYVSENMTKVGFIADGPLDSSGKLQFSFNEFDEQISPLAGIKGETPAVDLHGPIWHTSLTPALKTELLSNPSSAKFHIEDMLTASFAHFPFIGFDVNEVQRTTGSMDVDYDYWRGPINSLPGDSRAGLGNNGSVWYEAFSVAETASPGYWPHGAGYWWLHAVGWANTNSKKVVYQDFNFEAGRAWGAGDNIPAGFEPRTDEHLKRRRILDALNYAAVHGFRIDAVTFQAHIRTNRVIDENDLIAFLWSATSMGLDVEVTELDVEPVGAPAGSSDGSDAAAAFAGIYTERFLSLILANSPMYRVGGWSDWSPPGKLQRLAMVNRTGNTPIGLGVLAALGGALAPDQRSSTPVMRRYMLTNGVAGDLWRAASDPTSRGFAASGNKDGTKVEPGSGGAVLPLTNGESPLPGGPVAPVWSDEGVIRDYDPSSMAATFQWYDSGDLGTRFSLLSNGALLLSVGLNGSGEIEISNGTGTQSLGPVTNYDQNRVCLSWTNGNLDISLDNGSNVLHATGIPLLSVPDQIRLMGNGATTSQSRACVMELFKEPMDAASRSDWALRQGATFATSADYEARSDISSLP